jgi:hypothetical protein
VEHVFLEPMEQQWKGLLVWLFESEGSYILSLDRTIAQLFAQRKLTRFPILRFPSPFVRIGLLKRLLKEVSVPKNPGIRKSNRLHSSRTLF